MTKNEHPLARLAERGEEHGPDNVMRSARAEVSRRRPPTRTWLPAASAVFAVVAAVVLLASRGDDQSDVRTAGPTPDPTATPAPSSDPPRSTDPTTTPAEVPWVTAFGFVGEDGIVRIVHPAQGGAAEPQPVDAVRGEEGSTSLAVAPGGDVVYHDTFFSGCLTNLVRTEVGVDSQVLVENAANPALDQAGERLAYSSGTECTPDGDVLAVRDLASGETESVRIGDDDGLPYRIHDVEWVGDRVAVLASQYDGTPVAQMVLLYSVPESEPPVFDSQLPLGDQGRGTLDDFAYPNIEPVPGDPGSVLRARSSAEGGTDLVVLDLASGDERTLFSIDEQMTAFAARTLDDVLYVATEPKVPGEQAQGDTLWRRVGGQDLRIADDVTSVALATP